MNIDEYLDQFHALKEAEAKAYYEAQIALNKATGSRSSSYFDGMPRSKDNYNTQESLTINYTDAVNEWRRINKERKRILDQIQMSLYNMLYWEGMLLEHVYIFNVITDKENRLEGAAEILNTTDMGVVTEKLRIAKNHLRQILIDQGENIE